MAKPTDLVQGTLDFLILKTISLEPKHGWAIAKRIQQISERCYRSSKDRSTRLTPVGAARVDQSQMEGNRDGTGSQVLFADGAGRAQLEREAENWSRLSAAIHLVVETT